MVRMIKSNRKIIKGLVYYLLINDIWKCTSNRENYVIVSQTYKRLSSDKYYAHVKPVKFA